MITQDILIPAAMSLPADHGEAESLSPLELSIVRAISYADVFDYPLTVEEIHRSLVGQVSTREQVQALLDGSRLVPSYLDTRNAFYFLSGREQILEERQRRASASSHLWLQAEEYGRQIARIPFVRMVAVSGALAVDNARPGDDIDFFIVTEANRLWLCRALVIMLVKRAARGGDLICPNYFLSTNALTLPERDLYTAHEMVQMAPISGFDVYREILSQNAWVFQLLPNAKPRQETKKGLSGIEKRRKRILESLLRLPPASLVEWWEMKRKISKLSGQKSLPYIPGQFNTPPEVDDSKERTRVPVELSFSADRCKGHFNLHGLRTLSRYQTQMYLISGEE